MTDTKFAQTKDLPTKLPSDKVVQLFEKYKDEESIEELVSACLNATWKVLERADVIHDTAIEWFRGKNESLTIELDEKFSDGIANAKAIASPDEFKTLRFYNDEYRPDIKVKQLYCNMASLTFPTHEVIFSSKNIEDIRGTGDVITDKHHNGYQPDTVIPLYLYSASQSGRRYVWGLRSEEQGDWKVIAGTIADQLEETYLSADNTNESVLTIDKELLSGFVQIVSSDLQVTTLPESLSNNWSLYNTVTTTGSKVLVMRYINIDRGDNIKSPYHETVAWIPQQCNTSSLNSIPSSGIIEYLSSRPAPELNQSTEQDDDAQRWSSSFALGMTAVLFVSDLFKIPDQQTFDLSKYQQFQTLVQGVLGSQEERRVKEIDLKQLLAYLASQDSGGDSFLTAVKIYADSQQIVIRSKFPASVIRKLIEAKLGTNAEPPPSLLAHSLEIQEVYWKGQSYLLSLSGDRKYVVSPSPDYNVIEIYRLNSVFDNQIFWLLNAAMRNKQLGVRTHVDICNGSEQILKGKYYYDNGEWCHEDDPTKHSLKYNTSDKKWYTNGDIEVLKGNYWVQYGDSLLQQFIPLMYYLDVALEKVHQSRQIPKTYRGIKNVTLSREMYDDGKVILWSAYSSSTSDRAVASSFAKDNNARAAVFSLEGISCVRISQWSRFSRERELLFPPNTSFYINSSLTEDQQEMLGISNLQLYSMTEIDLIGTIVVYLRNVVNHVTQTVEPKKVPRHVRQLFRIMRCFEQRQFDSALEFTIDPHEPVFRTPEGCALSRMLIEIGASKSVTSKIAMNYNCSDIHVLSRLVYVTGIDWSHAFDWLQQYEHKQRHHFQQLYSIHDETFKTIIQTEIDALVSVELHQRYKRDRLQLNTINKVILRGLSGRGSYLNGDYVKVTNSSGNDYTASPFMLSASRANSWPLLGFDELKQVWFLDDMYMKDQRLPHNASEVHEQELLSPEQTTHFTWSPAFSDRIENFTLLGPWTHNGKVVFTVSEILSSSEENPPTPNWTAEDQKSFTDCKEEGIPVDDYQQNGGHRCRQSDAVPVRGNAGNPWWGKESHAGRSEKIVLYTVTEFQLPAEATKSKLLSSRKGCGRGGYSGGYGCTYNVTRSHTNGKIIKNKKDKKSLSMVLKLKESKQSLIDLEKKISDNVDGFGDTYTDKIKKYQQQRDYNYEAVAKYLSNITTWRSSLRSKITVNFSPQDTDGDYSAATTNEIKSLCGVYHQTSEDCWVRQSSSIPNENDAKISKCDDGTYEITNDKRVILTTQTFMKTLSTVTWIAEDNSTWVCSLAKPTERSFSHSSISPKGGQIITIHTGQAGIQIGSALWHLYATEPKCKSMYSDCLFNDTGLARALFIDSDASVTNRCLRNKLTYKSNDDDEGKERMIFTRDNVITCGSGSDAVTWGVGKTMATEQLMNDIQRQLESCDRISGIQFIHSANGGTGSPMVQSLIEHAGDDYKRICKQCFPVMPSMTRSLSCDSPISYYNCCLYIKSMTEIVDLIVPFDNHALYNNLNYRIGASLKRASFSDANELVANVISSTHDSIRMHSSYAINMWNSSMNLSPFKNFVYAWAGHAPLTEGRDMLVENQNLTALGLEALSIPLLGVPVHDKSLKLFSTGIHMRGEKIAASSAHMANYGVMVSRRPTWFEKSYLSVCRKRPPRGKNFDRTISVSTLSTGAPIGCHMEAMARKQKMLYSKRSFCHWMNIGGVENETLAESCEYVRNLAKKYKNGFNDDCDF